MNQADQDVAKDSSHAKWMRTGLPNSQRSKLPTISPQTSSLMQADLVSNWAHRSIWEFWCQGTIERYYISQWLMSDEARKGAQALARFLLGASQLVHPEGVHAEKICNQLSTGLAGDAPGVQKVAFERALAQLLELHPLMVTAQYDSTKLVESLQPLLDQQSDARLECSALFDDAVWSSELVLMQWLAKLPVTEESFPPHYQRPLGVGGFGIVSLAFKSDTGIPYALKRAKIGRIDAKESDKEAAKLEWKLTSTMKSRFLVDSSFGYINTNEIVLCLRVMPGGDLNYYLKKRKKFDLNTTRYYLATVVCGLEALHNAKIAYRDMKAPNILLDVKGRGKLSDFGLAADTSANQPTGSAGTSGFWSPEQLSGDPYSFTCDLWTLGVCAYHWSTGKKPFDHKVKDEAKALVKKGEYDKSLVDNPDLQSLLDGLMVMQPAGRLGAGRDGFVSIRSHAYFKDMDWTALMLGKLDGTLEISQDILAPSQQDVEKKIKEMEKKLDVKSSENYLDWAFVNDFSVAEDLVELIEFRPEVFAKAVDTSVPPVAGGERRRSADLKRRPSFSELNNVDSTAAIAELKIAAEANANQGGCCLVQ